MNKLTAIPTLFVDTTVGPCAVKVSEPSIETILLQFIAGWVADGHARLIKLPPNMVVTGSIVELNPKEERHEKSD